MSEEQQILTPPRSKPTPIFSEVTRESITSNYAWNKAQEDSVITGDPSLLERQYQSYLVDDTVRSDVVEMFAQFYNDELLTNTGVLDGLHHLPPKEQIQRINHELKRVDANKLSSRQALTIQMMRAGYGDQSVKLRDEVFAETGPIALDGLSKQLQAAQKQRLQREVDAIVAPIGSDFTITGGTLEAIQSEFVPLFSIATRVAATRSFKPKESKGLASYWPGEIRQDIREWFVDASIEDRIAYLQEIGKEVERLRKGKYAPLFTDYLVIEQLQGIFTEGVLDGDTPKSTWDRVIGNLDLLLETIYGIGLIAKVGTRSVKAVFKANNVSSVRQAARTSGNTEALEELDENIRYIADRLGISVEEASAVDMPRPASMREELEVLPDSTKEVLEAADNVRARVVVNSASLNNLGLNDFDRALATANEIRAIDNADGVHVNHRMLTIEDMPNDVGVRITAVLGRTPGNGWDDFGELIDDLVDLDPRLEEFEIVARNKVGELTKLDISGEEVAKFVVNGEMPIAVEQRLIPESASTRLFQGKKLSTISRKNLLWWSQNVDPNSTDFKNISEELARRANGVAPDGDTLRMLDGDEFYIRTTRDHYWHPGDKEFLGADTFQNTGLLPSGWVAPNARFGPDVYEKGYAQAYLVEQGLSGQFNVLLKPFYKLKTKDKRVVANLFEWAEDFAKNQAESGAARKPKLSEIRAQFADLTDAQLNGYVAIQEANNILWELFNRRMFRDYTGRGLKTARPVDPSLPRYHGVEIARESINRSSGTFLDPVLNEAVTLSKAEIDDIYNAGGSVIKLDFPITAGKGGKVDRIVLRDGDYELGGLSTRPLEYYEGYWMRFYDDPYYIVKVTENPTINGKIKKGETIEEAIRTAGTDAEGHKFIRNLLKDQKNVRRGVSYKVVRAKDIDNVEGTLLQDQVLHTEGRMFWDHRNYERLPDVNGNRARLNDIVRATEKGIAMGLRQTTHEDLTRTLRGAFANTYEKLLDPIVLKTHNIKEVIEKLRSLRRKTTDITKKKQINEAIKLAKYFRLQLGTDSRSIPIMREFLINQAAWIGRMGVRVQERSPTLAKPFLSTSRYLEGAFQSFDPYRFMKSVAFTVFMVARPARQFALQSMQIMYLSPIDPVYVSTGQIFKDSLALRRGIQALRHSNYTDGLKNSVWAKTMGLTNNEYRRLVQEFERSGLLETVNVHTHAGGVPKYRRIPLPSEALLSRVAYKGKQWSHGALDLLQKGFDIGEQNNLSLTYMMALRRMMKRKGVKSLTELSRKDFDKLTIESSNLALAMIKPNKFGYQSGYASVFTQFLSFSHKAVLGILGGNPAISRAEAFKIAMGTYLLYGANMFGSEDWVREQLSLIGLGNRADEEINNGITLVDILSAGLIESGINAIAKASNEEWKDLDFGFLAPGVNVAQIYQTVFENILDQPEKALLGPFYNPASGFLKGAEALNTLIKGDPDIPAADKFLEGANMFLTELLPGYNDAVKAYQAATLGVWKDKSGDILPLQPTWNTIIARALVGQRSKEELVLYRLKNRVWEQEENIRNAVETNKEFLRKMLDGWYKGEYSDEYFYNKMRVLSNMYEEWPEGIRIEILRRSAEEPNRTGKSAVEMIIENIEKGGSGPTLEPWIKQAPGMTPEERRKMLLLNEEIYGQLEDGEKRYLEISTQDLERRK